MKNNKELKKTHIIGYSSNCNNYFGFSRTNLYIIGFL